MKRMVEKRCQALSKSIDKRNGERAAEFTVFVFDSWHHYSHDQKLQTLAMDKARKAALAKYNMMGTDLATHVFTSWREHTVEQREEAMERYELLRLALMGWHTVVHNFEIKRQMQDRVLHNMAHAMNVATEALVAQIVSVWGMFCKEAELRKQRDEETFKRFAMKFDMGNDALLSAVFQAWGKAIAEGK